MSSTVQMIALTMVAASVYQMMRSGAIIFTAIISFFFLKRKIYRHHILGIGLITIGIVLVGIAALVV
jgi:drug/metabolite transporter (DMT)-like permease